MDRLVRTGLLVFIACCADMLAARPLEVGSHRELFVDRYLVDQLDNVQLVMGRPELREVSLNFDEPWEKAANYVTVLKDEDVYRLYYRGCTMTAAGEYDGTAEVTCYAESRDGIHWVKPKLRLHEFLGTRENNLILGPDARRISSNFAPFIDLRPGVPADERFKAVGGLFNDNSGQIPDGRDAARAGGLVRLASADGIRWRILEGAPLFAGYALDTLNCPMWVPAENCYVIYLRTWSEGGTPEHPAFRGYRTISRSVSQDFIHWSRPERMDFGDSPAENIYTNGTHPYFRAPHLLISLAFRFSPERQVVSDSEETSFGVHYTQKKGVSDAVLMTSRGGNRYDRTFMESFIRPGLDRKSWTARSNAPARGVVPTGENEMSLYLVTRYTMPDCRLQRYSLRLDGFASAHASFTGGTLTTKTFQFTGQKLTINYATSSVGSIRVQMLDADGRPIPGFAGAESDEIIGDEITRTVAWKSASDLSALAGKPVRLRFQLKDADLYSFQFQP